MNKMEVQKLTNLIKGYYNSQFFIDEYVVEAWYVSMKPYEYDDAVKHIQEYLKEYPDTPPKPHTFKKGLYTKEEKEKIKNSSYIVQCNLCNRFLTLSEYDNHYERCLDIEYLLNIAKQKGEQYTRVDLENCKPMVIDKLLEKYVPKETMIENFGSLLR